jgi:hypothetical protein
MKGLIAIGIVLSSSACGDEASNLQRELGGDPPATVPENSGSEVIVVRNGDFSEGEVPAPSTDTSLPQIVNLTAPYAVTNGGTLVLHAELSTAVAAPTFMVQLAGQPGYHTVVGTDPEGDRIYDISVRVPADVTFDVLRLSLALLDGAGNAGPAREIEVQLLQSGTGDVKVTLSFDRLHDLDLHVTEPTGDQIFYQRPMSTLGGQLDLDSGARCEPSAANAENIFWPPGGAPVGQYSVSVQNYQQCSPGAIAFTVTVQHGTTLETHEGSFEDGTAGEQPTASNVRQVATFELAR